jgi:hypothetical protein
MPISAATPSRACCRTRASAFIRDRFPHEPDGQNILSQAFASARAVPTSVHAQTKPTVRETIMTPQERQLVADLFARLATLESGPRDADAVRAINDGLQQAPNAIYALVQTVLVQEEALKRADARIRALEGDNQPPEQGGFLETMRSALGGGRRDNDAPRGSVPNTGGGDTRWGTQAAGSPFAQGTPPNATAGAPAPGERGGGSFLGTAAATAAGVIGGSLLMNSISSMFGNRGQASGQAFAGEDARSGASGDSPWGNAAGGDLSREAGLNDIGGDQRRASLFDANDPADGDGGFDDGFDDDFGGDFGGDAA